MIKLLRNLCLHLIFYHVKGSMQKALQADCYGRYLSLGHLLPSQHIFQEEFYRPQSSLVNRQIGPTKVGVPSGEELDLLVLDSVEFRMRNLAQPSSWTSSTFL